MTFTEQVHNLLRSAAMECTSAGNFKERVNSPDGTEVTHEFAHATAMAWQAKKTLYSRKFGATPPWVNLLHPLHRIRICDLSIHAAEPLPDIMAEEIITMYLFSRGKSLEEGNNVAVTTFEVFGSRTLVMADFKEPETRAQCYDSVSDRWSDSPTHLVDAMEECTPLAWPLYSIYSEVRDEIQSTLDQIVASADLSQERTAALTARINAMPEEPEEGAKAWLLSLTNSEFATRVVPEIRRWFNSPPDRRWEDDYLPQNSTAQGAALEFFESLDSETLDMLAVELVYGDRPGSTYYAAELTTDAETANKAAAAAGIPVRFKRGAE